MPPKNPTTPTILSSATSTPSAESSPTTKQDASRSHQIGATHMWSSSTYLMPTISDWSPSKTGLRKNSSKCTMKHMTGWYSEGSTLNSTNWTMKFVRSQHTHLQYTPPPTCIVPTQQNEPYRLGKIIFYQELQGSQSRSPSPTGANSPPNATPPSICSVGVSKIPAYRHTKPSKAHSPSTQHQWHHSGQKY